eukprot:2705235-Amphidinium_carterae.1
MPVYMEELEEKEGQDPEEQAGDEDQKKQQDQIKRVKKRCLMKEQQIMKAMQQVRGVILRLRDTTHLKLVGSMEQYVMANP